MAQPEEGKWESVFERVADSLSPPPSGLSPMLVIYRNHRSEVSERHITPLRLRYSSDVQHGHPEEQWLLECWDHDKQDRRTYALKDCNFLTATLQQRAHKLEARVIELEQAIHTLMARARLTGESAS